MGKNGLDKPIYNVIIFPGLRKGDETGKKI
jgi:hypothetical protein